MKQEYLDPLLLGQLLQHAEFDFLENIFDEQAAAAVSEWQALPEFVAASLIFQFFPEVSFSGVSLDSHLSCL
jgi:hypothetical protein